jgi:hypothetical protein
MSTAMRIQSWLNFEMVGGKRVILVAKKKIGKLLIKS